MITDGSSRFCLWTLAYLQITDGIMNLNIQGTSWGKKLFYIMTKIRAWISSDYLCLNMRFFHACMYKSHLLCMYVPLPLPGDCISMTQEEWQHQIFTLGFNTLRIRASLEV